MAGRKPRDKAAKYAKKRRDQLQCERESLRGQQEAEKAISHSNVVTAVESTPVSAIPALTLRSPLICCFIAVFSDISFCPFMYFGLVFTILDRIRAKIIQNRQINVKMSTCNLTKIAKSVILETFFGLEDNK